METWKTTTKRFVPQYKTHPRSWREKHLGADVLIELCRQCNHDMNRHFYEEDYPEFCFCLEGGCNCSCDWTNEQTLT